MGKIFEALKKAEKQRLKLIEKAGDDPSLLRTAEGEVDAHLVTYFDRMSPISEQYRLLRSNLRSLHTDNPPQAMVITSAESGEGKTVTTLNLAMTYADDRENRVIVVDADLRKPTVHRMLALDNQKGLSDYLAGNVMMEMVLQRTRLPNLSVLPAGRLPANPTELLSGSKMRDLIKRLSRDYGVVLIDTPSVSKHEDAAILAGHSDGAVVAIRMGKTARETAFVAVNSLTKSGCRILGAVLTHVTDDYRSQARAFA